MRPFVLSDRALRNLSRLKQLHDDEFQRSGRVPTREELAERSGLDPIQIDDLVATEAGRSLDEPVRGVDGELGTFGDLLVDPLAEDEYERVRAGEARRRDGRAALATAAPTRSGRRGRSWRCPNWAAAVRRCQIRVIDARGFGERLWCLHRLR
jgi:hypothetical protein